MRFKTLAALIFGSLVLSIASAATVNYTAISAPDGQQDTILVTWTPLLNGDTGQSATIAQYADRTVQAIGTFGSGGSVQLEGSDDGVTWTTLTDLGGTTIVKTVTGGMSVVAENPRFIRPNVTAGDGTTSITVTVIGKR